MIRQAVVLFAMFLREIATTSVSNRKAEFTTNENMYLPYVKGEIFVVASIIQCSHKCLSSSIQCVGANFNTFPVSGRYQCEIAHIVNDTAEMESRSRWIFMEGTLKVSICFKLLRSSIIVSSS